MIYIHTYFLGLNVLLMSDNPPVYKLSFTYIIYILVLFLRVSFRRTQENFIVMTFCPFKNIRFPLAD